MFAPATTFLTSGGDGSGGSGRGGSVKRLNGGTVQSDRKRLRSELLSTLSRRRNGGGGGGGGGGLTNKRFAGGGLSRVLNQAIMARNTSAATTGTGKSRTAKRYTDEDSSSTTSSTAAAIRRKQSGGSSKVTSSSSTVVVPTLRAYRTYANIVETDSTLVPSVTDERAYAMIETSDVNLHHAETFFDDKFLKAVTVAFGCVKLVSSVKQIYAQIYGQLHGTGAYRKWNNWYDQDDRLGLLHGSEGPPFVVCVSTTAAATTVSSTPTLTSSSSSASISSSISSTALNKHSAKAPPARNNGARLFRGSNFAAFLHARSLRPIRVAVGRVLYQSEKISLVKTPRVDSLWPQDLKQLRDRSVYYRRIYLIHLLIYSIVTECLKCGKNEKPVVLVVEPKLRSLLQLPTSLSVALHADPLIRLHYLTI